MEQVNERVENISWVAFIGFMFLGMGIGACFNQPGIGMLIGMGVGYLAEAVLTSTIKQKSA
ncbi:MAG: hypothetical protein EBZ77_10930 [Chitinophagia bacterium]|nr:hypothetical protein [Chitinophagia bacterium]